jgi:ribosomal protein S3AE
MLQGELSRVLAHGVKSLYPLKKIEIRRSEILGTIVEELPTPEPVPAAPEGPAPEETAVPEGGPTPA